MPVKGSAAIGAFAVVLAIATMPLAGCGSAVRWTYLAPGANGTFIFGARTNTVMTENDDGAAERIRRDWLADSLTTGGVCRAGYVVDNRRFVQYDGGPFANGGDIVYAGRCLAAGTASPALPP
jgi:hypothetical protein